MKKKITKRAVDSLTPGQLIWDSELKGFGCRCLSSARKSYVIKYRKGTRQRWYTVGSHGILTPDSARKKAKRLLGRIEDGADPSADKERNAKAGTVADLGEAFIEKHAKPHRPKSAPEYERILVKYVVPKLGKLNAKDVTKADINDLKNDMKTTPYMANRCLALVSSMFSRGSELRVDVPSDNPCRGVERFAEHGRERYLSQAEIKRLGNVLRDAEAKQSETVYGIAAIRLLLLTGARVGEILTAKWSYYDVKAGTLRLPDSKTGAKVIFLPPEAIALIKKVPKQSENPYIICGAVDGEHLVNLSKPWSRLRNAAKLGDVRLHDLRHTYASAAVNSGLSLPIIGKLLGHKKPQTTARYAHLADDPIREAAKLTGGAISDGIESRTIH